MSVFRPQASDAMRAIEQYSQGFAHSVIPIQGSPRVQRFPIWLSTVFIQRYKRTTLSRYCKSLLREKTHRYTNYLSHSQSHPRARMSICVSSLSLSLSRDHVCVITLTNSESTSIMRISYNWLQAIPCVLNYIWRFRIASIQCVPYRTYSTMI
jgi:hypothetical protein